MKHFATFIFFTVVLSGIGCSQNHTQVINDIDVKLKTGELTISAVLTDPSFMYLHSVTALREIIKKHAKAEKINIASGNEPGTRITVSGTVTDKNNNPLNNLLVYVYQTSDKGWYSDTGAHILVNMGDIKHARLFGYFKTDHSGRFEFETIKPKGYPKSDLAAHIHIHMWTSDNKPVLGITGELQFEDDPRMTTERKKRSIADGYLIAPNTGTYNKPVYKYAIVSRY